MCANVQVVVAEGAPTFDGHLMAKKLSNAGIQTTLIPDSAVFAMMARAHKVGQWLLLMWSESYCLEHMHVC